jgi:hypothetical protein
MFHSFYYLGGSHRVFEVDGKCGTAALGCVGWRRQAGCHAHACVGMAYAITTMGMMGGTAKRVRELGGELSPFAMILFAFLLSPDTQRVMSCE